MVRFDVAEDLKFGSVVFVFGVLHRRNPQKGIPLVEGNVFYSGAAAFQVL